MVLIRESPRVKQSPDRNNAQWPPKSPFQALLSSPSGRKKWQDHRSRADQRSPSPSPRRRQMASGRNVPDVSSGLEDDEDDEETLQLKLQQIETRLKLKKLQQKSKRGTADDGDRVARRAAHTTSRPQSWQPEVEVPLSPVRAERSLTEHVSPVRRRLGLTAPDRAQEVSLKRARPLNGVGRTSSLKETSRGGSHREAIRPKSFGERLAASTSQLEEREAKRDRLEQIRSAGYGQRASTPSRGSRQLPRSFVEPGSEALSTSVAQSASTRSAHTDDKQRLHVNDVFSETRAGTGHDESGDETDNDPDCKTGYDSFSKTHLSRRIISHADVAREMEDKEIYTLPRLLKEIQAPEYEAPDCEADYVVFGILASKSSPHDQAHKHKATDGHGDEKLEAPKNKFMVLHLTDLKWEVDLFLFGSAFNRYWKLTPGTLLAILNPAIMPPKGNQNTGKFSLKIGSSEDSVLEIGVARDLGYCISVKKDGQQCGDWIDKRKTEICEYHINMQVDKARKHRMEVNAMFRGTGVSDGRSGTRIVRDSKQKKDKPIQHHREYGTLYHAATGMGKSAASLLDSEDTDALHNMTREEASRKRIAAAQRDRDLAKRLGEMGRGVGAEYLRSQNPSSKTSRTGDAAEEARSALFSKPTAAELGLGANDASEAHLSPAKDRRRHFGLGEMSTTRAKARDRPVGWAGAKKVGLDHVPRRRENVANLEEEGQTRLDLGRWRDAGALNESEYGERLDRATTTSSSTMAASSESASQPGAARMGFVRPRSQESSLRSNGSTSPAKKRARFALEKGIREPGRDSLPGAGGAAIAAGHNSFDDDDDSDDIGLDIV